MIIQHVHIFIGDGQIIEDGYIEIEDGKILSAGPAADCKEALLKNVIDGGGRWAFPGFIDAHCHIGMWEDGLGFEGADGNEDTDPSTPQLRAIDAVNPMERSFAEALDWGVTTVVTGPGSANPVAGQVCVMKTYGDCVDDMVIKAPSAIKFALGENPKLVYEAKDQAPNTRMATASVIREQLRKAQRYAQDMDKAVNDEECDPPEFDAKSDALLPLIRGEIPAHFHAHRADDIFTAVRICKEFDLRFVLIHCTEGRLIAPRLSQLGIRAVCGPLIGTRSKPELRNAAIDNPAALSRAGVETAICTDHPELPIHCLALSAAMAVSGGMEREDALQAITGRAARIAGVESCVGTLEAGKDADIILFSEDPLGVAVKPDVVIAAGKIVRGTL